MRVAVVGLGKLGACQALLFAEAGLEVMGIDVDPDALDALKRGVTTNPEPHLAEMLATYGPSIDWRSDPADAAEADVVFCVVPTPSLDSGAYDPSAVYSVADQIADAEPADDLVFCVVSTLTPGDGQRLAANVPFAVVGSPEFIALGDVFAGMRRPDLLLIGESESWAGDRVLTALRAIKHGQPDNVHPGMRYTPKAPAICRMSLTEAEVAKVALNAFLVTKIGFANTVGEICRGLGISPHPVTRAIGADHRVGHALLRPGGPAGGPCLPRDSKAFGHVAQLAGAKSSLTDMAGIVNEQTPMLWAERIAEMNPRKVAILGTAYKPGTDVTVEAFGLLLAMFLSAEGIPVVTWDPLAVCDEPDLDTAVASADLVVVATAERPDFIHPNVVDCWA
jgi:UDPglucose 6-dehydrogenase